MKLSIFIAFIALICMVHAQPPPMNLQEKVDHVSNFINKFPGTREDLEKVLMQRMTERAKDLPKDIKKEDIERFISAVASKLDGKVMTGDDFKKFAATHMTATPA